MEILIGVLLLLLGVDRISRTVQRSNVAASFRNRLSRLPVARIFLLPIIRLLASCSGRLAMVWDSYLQCRVCPFRKFNQAHGYQIDSNFR
jgi:hypothetical protein